MSANDAISGGQQPSQTDNNFDFRAENIVRRDKIDYFVNSDTSKKRSRAAVREERAAQRRLKKEAMRSPDIGVNNTFIDPAVAAQNVANSEKKQLRKLANEEKRVRYASKFGTFRVRLVSILKKIFTLKKCLIYLAVIAAIVGTIIALNVHSENVRVEQENVEDTAYAEYQEKYAEEEEDIIMYFIESGLSKKQLLEEMETKRNSLDKDGIMYFMVSVRSFRLVSEILTPEDAINKLLALEPAAKYEFEKEAIYYELYYQYTHIQDFANGNKYADKLNALKRRYVPQDVVSSEEFYKEW